MSLNAFFDLMETSDEKYEYADGYLFLMSGGTLDHSRMALNLGPLLDLALRDTSCMVYNSDVWTRAAENTLLLPDLVVSCDPSDQGRKTVVDVPKLVIEVLSDSTEKRDRGRKFEQYRNCPTIEEYAMVNHRIQLIEVYHRTGRFWTYRTYAAGEECELESVAVRFAVTAVYDRTSVPPEARPEDAQD
jgi:Uma2 family endonuclease